MTGPSTRDVSEAVVDLLSIALDVGPHHAKAWSQDDLQRLPDRERPHRHVVVHVTERGGLPLRTCGATDRRSFRIVLRASAPYEATVLRLLDLCDQTLRYTRFFADGYALGPVQFETEDGINSDKAGYSAASAYTATY